MGGYEDEVWRARHGYKEEKQHDAPFRRNRDFKAVPYGNFIGMPNYRHSEPWCQLKNIKDLANEEHHHPTKWVKQGLLGGMVGVFVGTAKLGHLPEAKFTSQKLLQSVGNRPWSGRLYRLFMKTAPYHFFLGASVILSYSFIMEMMRHHDETNLRPKFFDHQLAITLICGVGNYLTWGQPWHFAAGAVFGFVTIGPALWWMKLNGGLDPHNRPASVFYENDATPEEIERFQQQD